ncbi:MAG: trigger factor [Sphaerochaeta sp.]|jgi:trigger factor|nr:trigger factor [Sphaerochaeta sp.]MDX9914804.1 trigger factor [Sphaerochaeta sp.]
MIVDTSIKELENSSVALTVTVGTEAVEKDYQAALKKYASTIQIKGFRKGKAPVSVLEGKFGKAIREESGFNTIEEALKEAIEKVEEKHKPLSFSVPVLQDEEGLLPFEANKDVTFTVHYDVMPSFDLPQYKGLELTIPKVKVDEAVIDAEIQQLLQQNAMIIDKDGEAAMGDIATVDYVELDEEGDEVAGTERKEFTFTLGSGTNFYQFDEDMVGMKVDEERSISKTYSEDSTVEGYAGQTIQLRVKLLSLRYRDVPVLDDEFAQDVKDEYKTVDDLMSATREKLQKALEEQIEGVKFTTLSDKLIEMTPIAIPQSMIDFEAEQSWRRYLRQLGLGEEQVMEFMNFRGQSRDEMLKPMKEQAEKTLRLQLIMDKVKETEKFEVDEDEVLKVLDEQASGVSDEDQLASYRTMIEDDMRFSKVGPFLLEQNTFIEGEEVPYAAFMDGSYNA